MRILFLSGRFIHFYRAIITELSVSYEVSLYCAFLQGGKVRFEECKDSPYPIDDKAFNEGANIAQIVEFMREKQITLILNPDIAVLDICRLLEKIRTEFPQVNIFNLIHSRPNSIVYNKQIQLKEMSVGNINSFKQLIQFLFPSVYLYLLRKHVRQSMNNIYHLYDQIIVLSPSYIQEYEKIVGFECQTKLRAIPNPRFRYTMQTEIYNKNKTIVFVGRISEEKALYRLLIIWSKIYQDIPEWELQIIGDGSMRKDYEKMCRRLALPRVSFQGHQESKIFIDKASVLCLVSNFEGLPTVFMEAMTLGVVPIGFDSFSAIYDLIDHQKNGIIVPAFDLDQYAVELKRLAINNEARIKMAQEAQEKVKKYDVENVSGLWLELFKDFQLL